MAEYIYKIESDEDDESEIFIGWIRNHSQELIRCKDCKFWDCDDDETFCAEWGTYGTEYNSYCSYGRRKEE